MDEKGSYTPEEVAMIYYATLHLDNLSNGTTTIEKSRMYEKIVPKNVRDELTRLCLLSYPERYSLLEKEAQKKL